MRPLRLLLSLSTSLVAVSLLLLYATLGSQQDEQLEQNSASGKQGGFKALFSFTSPGSLFPPSAIISLTDDNSTFFLARPAAFGPALPKDGLSSPLWIGSGFGDDALDKGELGCSDSPGWDDHDSGIKLGSKHPPVGNHKTGPLQNEKDTTTRTAVADTAQLPSPNDGTDDHLRQSFPRRSTPSAPKEKNAEHADIQSLQESAEIEGKVVLLKRGGCGFLEKVMWAQNRGAVAVIVGDHVRGGGLIRMYAKGDTSNVTISSLFTSHTTAHLLSSLLPSRANSQGVFPGEAAKLDTNNSGKDAKDKGKGGTKQNSKSRPTSSHGASKISPTAKPVKQHHRITPSAKDEVGEQSWLDALLSLLSLDTGRDDSLKTGSRRPPSSGDLDWIQAADWDDDQNPIKTKLGTAHPTSTQPLDGFVIGEQDWRDPDLLSVPTTAWRGAATASPTPVTTKTGGGVLPGSGEYAHTTMTDSEHKAWWKKWYGLKEDNVPAPRTKHSTGRSITSITDANLNKVETSSDHDDPHEGLWVTLTPTNVSTSPFFDTLLVLVVSPLVTLTVVYALLLLRSRIRRRRWRAPKSLVERLPVRTYQTISDSASSATPNASSPTTPLLQHSSPPPTSPIPTPAPQAESDAPATSSSFQHRSRTREEEKRETGLAEWRRRYGGRQRECVVCLEEYEDGVSQVMSLPCGHEFHADCITPWLVTRRRTCPICKGDVVRSLAQSYHDRLPSLSPTRSTFHLNDVDEVQAQAAETRNDSPLASLPMPIPASPSVDRLRNLDNDVEANWSEDNVRHEPIDVPISRVAELSSSVRDLSSTVSTVIWRGVEAVRNTTGFQRRPPEDVDRDR